MIQSPERFARQLDESNPHRRLQWVLGGRLIIATVLLGATMYLALDAIRYGHFTPTFLLILISAIYGSSILFGVWLLRGHRETVVAVAITTLDVLLITGLVYLTGGAGSIFSFLYGAQILTAALTLATRYPTQSDSTGGMAFRPTASDSRDSLHAATELQTPPSSQHASISLAR